MVTILDVRNSVNWNCSYFIQKKDKLRYLDDEVASLLNIETIKYKKLMIEKFNGYESTVLEGIAFRNNEDAKLAAKFINDKIKQLS